MNATQEDRNLTNETQLHEADTLQDLPVPTLTEADADCAEEIKGGKAILYGRKSGDDKRLDY